VVRKGRDGSICTRAWTRGDPAMFFSVIAECVVIAAAGCLAPALRALRLDPAAAIRLN